MDCNRPFGAFLRARRSRLHPEPGEEVERTRRRTPGLRREDVARRAGISSEWYVKLEQGRVAAPSAETVAALGRALRLDPVDLAHLCRLARPDARPPFRREAAPAPLVRLVQALAEPAYVTGQRGDVLASNAAADALFGFDSAAGERNVYRWMLTDPAARALFDRGWAAEAARMVALFRAAHDLWPADAAFASLVADLTRACPEFARWWAAHPIAAPVAGTKRLHHPTHGVVSYSYASFQANDAPSLKLALYTRR